CQSQYITSAEAVASLSKSIIYSFLFTVEALSILENMIASGLYQLQPLQAKLLRSEHKNEPK
ncbi:MAG: hypothetical protein Q8N36_05400, partial [bacterium]|nr:hypothetical protein [bacterium]